MSKKVNPRLITIIAIVNNRLDVYCGIGQFALDNRKIVSLAQDNEEF